MAAPLYEEWQKPNKLDQIEQWASKGLTIAQIAENIGIDRSTLHRWMNDHRDICNAIKKGREATTENVVNSAYMLTQPQTLKETVTEEVFDKHGALVAKRRRTTRREVLPSITSIIWWLKNRDPENWNNKDITQAEIKKIEAETQKIMAETQLVEQADTQAADWINAVMESIDEAGTRD